MGLEVFFADDFCLLRSVLLVSTQARGTVPTTRIKQNSLFPPPCPPAFPSLPYCAPHYCPQSSRTVPHPRFVALGTPPRAPAPEAPNPARATAARWRSAAGAGPLRGPCACSAPHRPPWPLAFESGWPDTIPFSGEESPRAGWFLARAFPGARFGVLVSVCLCPNQGVAFGEPLLAALPQFQRFLEQNCSRCQPPLPTLELQFSMHFFP